MLKTILAVVFVLATLSGCTIPTYREPVSGSTANIIFRNTTGGNSAVSLYEDAEQCSRRSSSGVINPGGEKKLKVKANQQLAMTFSYATKSVWPQMTCQVTISFLPADAQTYEVILSEDLDKGRCFLGAKKIDPQDPKRGMLVETKQRAFRVGFDDNSRFCFPL